MKVRLPTLGGNDVCNSLRPIDPRSKATVAASNDYLASDGHPKAMLLGLANARPACGSPVMGAASNSLIA